MASPSDIADGDASATARSTAWPDARPLRRSRVGPRTSCRAPVAKPVTGVPAKRWTTEQLGRRKVASWRYKRPQWRPIVGPRPSADVGQTNRGPTSDRDNGEVSDQRRMNRPARLHWRQHAATRTNQDPTCPDSLGERGEIGVTTTKPPHHGGRTRPIAVLTRKIAPPLHVIKSNILAEMTRPYSSS